LTGFIKVPNKKLSYVSPFYRTKGETTISFGPVIRRREENAAFAEIKPEW